jgi:hypothetical protein
VSAAVRIWPGHRSGLGTPLHRTFPDGTPVKLKSTPSWSQFRPADLVNLPNPFDDERFIPEPKHDGFRAVAHISPDGCKLVSRRGNVYKSSTHTQLPT